MKFLYVNFIVSLWLTFLTTLLLGLFVFLRNRKNIVNKTFAFYCFSIAWWSFCQIWLIACDKKLTALTWTRIEQVGVFFIPTFFVHFVISLLDIKHRKWLLKVAYSISVFFAILCPTPLMMSDVMPKASVPYVKYFATAGMAYHFAILYFVIMVIYGLNKLYSIYKNSDGAKQNQLKYLLLSSLLGYFGGAANFLLVYGINIPFLNPFGTYALPVYIAVVTYAIMRYRLMDINIVLTRAGIFAFVYFLVLGIPFWVGFKLLGMGLWIIPVSITAVFATFGPFGYQILRRRAEDVILKEQKRYQKTLRELSKTMTRIRDLDELLKTVTSTIKDTVKVNFSVIYIKDEQYNSYRLKSYYANGSNVRLEEFIPPDSKLIKLIYSKKIPLLGEEVKAEYDIPFEFGLITPYFMEDELLGFLILGSKPNNQMYTPDDVLVFETLSYSTSLAIENSTFWKEIEDRHRKARLQEMDTYSYSLAHEIDNPMQVVLGQAGLLKKEVTDNIADEAKRSEIIGSFDFIIEAAKRVSGMVKAIRDFGQKTTGEFKALNIEDVADSFARLYYPQFKDKTVFFEKINNLKNPIFIRGEKPELMQVLVILANNSVHAMTDAKEKKATLILGLSNRDLVRITFTDNGYGIKKEMLEIIFKPFVTTKASTEGTGMGLHNAQKIIEKHKGRIWAESEGPGKGASFIIELPIAKDVTQDEVKKEDSKSKRLI